MTMRVREFLEKQRGNASSASLQSRPGPARLLSLPSDETTPEITPLWNGGKSASSFDALKDIPVANFQGDVPCVTEALVREIKSEYWQRFSNQIEMDLYGAQKRIWKLLREMKKAINKSMQLKTISNKWTNFFKELYIGTGKRELEGQAQHEQK
ncbi:hypothetical protein ILUMI_04701 [Ignelater luminosus]|uniref:Uncharacterized protein n=1 Tax=Ignelater luminosus TaxID=2038154 RepID=A0A8K0GEA8_IGNLU|nr:hypothetical protein ILUMI_04701 [Ignelater luminosus]